MNFKVADSFLAKHELTPQNIDIVVNTHLHGCASGRDGCLGFDPESKTTWYNDFAVARSWFEKNR